MYSSPHTLLVIVKHLNMEVETKNVPTADLKGLAGILCSLSETLLLLANFELEVATTQLFLSNAGLSALASLIFARRSPPPTEHRTAEPGVPRINGDDDTG